jgi:hypothetical protein
MSKNYPKSTSIIKWSNYLGRKLYFEEYELLESLKSELIMNKMLKNLYKILRINNNKNKEKLYIPLLTEANGNCLFESLVYYKIGDDIETLKLGISYFMYQLQNTKLPGQDETLKDKFNNFFCDDIEYVCDDNSEEIYKYKFNVMCKDICCKKSWNRLPTNLILILISWLFNCEIIILSDNTEYKNIINVYDNIDTKKKLKKIYLGRLGGELHYIPLDLLDENEKIKELNHEKVKKIFYEWANEVSPEI